jgi:hypothetical protein
MSSQQRFHGWKLATVALLAAGACDGGRQLRGDAPQIGLARGAHWSVVSLRPPHLNGPFFQLMLRQHVLTGWIAGDSAPGGALRVQIDEDGASGHGPLGPVAMDIADEPDALVAQGTWNGSRVHFAFSSQGMQGTVADNALPGVRSPFEHVPGMLPRSRGAELLAQAMEPPARNSSCQYVLDGHDPSGVLIGTSICDGLPVPTRLEVPAAAEALFTRAELVTLLVAVLSAPPLDPAEPMPGAGGPGDELFMQ